MKQLRPNHDWVAQTIVGPLTPGGSKHPTRSATAKSVTLEVYEAIVPGGVKRVGWKFRCPDRDDWVSVFDAPGVESERADQRPGVVWLTRVYLRLEPHTKLLREETRPAVRQQRDLMSYLNGASAGRKERTLRSEFRVATDGSLCREGSGRR